MQEGDKQGKGQSRVTGGAGGRRRRLTARVLAAVLSLLLLVNGLAAANRLLCVKSQDGIDQARAFYHQPENSIDVVFLGSSHIHCNINTAYLWTEYGIAAYDYSAAEQPLWMTYYWLREFCKTQKPKLVVVDVFGGGYGAAAEITGNPEVNINVVTGKYKETVVGEGARVVGSSVKNPGDEGYDAPDGFSIPAHAAGSIGNINTVFGGGNAAKVIGNTNVNIGTRVGDEVYGVVAVATGADVTAYYTRSGDTYTAATGTAVAGTTYYEKKKVAVRIVGNVFGGGNKAEVTGDTNVIIGKE